MVARLEQVAKPLAWASRVAFLKGAVGVCVNSRPLQNNFTSISATVDGLLAVLYPFFSWDRR